MTRLPLPLLLCGEEASITAAVESFVTGLKTPHLIDVEDDGGLLTDDEEPQLEHEVASFDQNYYCNKQGT
jgi:hypothetical protein